MKIVMILRRTTCICPLILEEEEELEEKEDEVVEEEKEKNVEEAPIPIPIQNKRRDIQPGSKNKKLKLILCILIKYIIKDVHVLNSCAFTCNLELSRLFSSFFNSLSDNERSRMFIKIL
jgi:hypothetical protein